MKTLTFDFDNVPGIASMYAIPPSGTLYNKLNNDLSPEELINLAGTIRIPVYDNDSFSYSEVQSLEEGGELWSVTINGLIPKLYQPDESTINLLERGDWFVLFCDKNGTTILSGSITVPLKFVSTRTTGGPSEANGRRFTFSGKSDEPSRLWPSS